MPKLCCCDIRSKKRSHNLTIYVWQSSHESCNTLERAHHAIEMEFRATCLSLLLSKCTLWSSANLLPSRSHLPPQPEKLQAQSSYQMEAFSKENWHCTTQYTGCLSSSVLQSSDFLQSSLLGGKIDCIQPWIPALLLHLFLQHTWMVMTLEPIFTWDKSNVSKCNSRQISRMQESWQKKPNPQCAINPAQCIIFVQIEVFFVDGWLLDSV